MQTPYAISLTSACKTAPTRLEARSTSNKSESLTRLLKDSTWIILNRSNQATIKSQWWGVNHWFVNLMNRHATRTVFTLAISVQNTASTSSNYIKIDFGVWEEFIRFLHIFKEYMCGLLLVLNAEYDWNLISPSVYSQRLGRRGTGVLPWS